MRVDLHNHTPRCNHAVGEPWEYLERAIELGVDIYGFACHAPMDFNHEYRMGMGEMAAYERDIRDLKARYAGRCEVLLAYEVDYLEGYMEEAVLNADVDYLIGSVHFLNGWGVDNPESIFEYIRRDIDDIWFGYFLALERMAQSGHFQIVGHMDLVKIFNYTPTRDIREWVERVLKVVKESQMAVEVNASGLRKPIGEQYPSRAILEMMYEMGVPLTFSSDAHSVEHVGFGYESVRALAKEIGFKECVYFKEKKMERVTF